MNRLAIVVAASAVALSGSTLFKARSAPPTVKMTALKTIDSSCYGPTIKPGVVCPGEETNPSAAANNPTNYAWTLFGQINQPAFLGNKVDTRRVWETWKNADDNSNPSDAIYLDNGHAPRPWQVQPSGGANGLAQTTPAPRRLSPIKQLQLLRQQKTIKGNPILQFDPSNPTGEEVRMNRPAFNYLLNNKMYNQQGQYQYASTHPDFDFPVASKEIKAVWLLATPTTKVSDFYSAKFGGKTYILVALHIISKDLPFWYWSSFVHKDKNKDPKTGYVPPLSPNKNIPPSLKGTPFENYRLLAEIVQTGSNKGPFVLSGKGAQTDWITRTGHPTIIGNPFIEQGVENQSSCITCHAHASITKVVNAKTSPYNNIPLDVGAVDPQDFVKNGNRYYPLDFLWSMRNAKFYKP